MKYRRSPVLSTMTSKQRRIFYGYWILAACFLLNLISAGCGPISFSFFVTSLEKALGWNRTEIMTAFTIFFICSAISAPFAGRLVHRFGGRKVMSLGALSATIGYTLISQMSSLWQYYIGYAFIGLGVAALGPVTTSLIVSNWFSRRRGMAIGIMSMGAGTAGTVFTPLVIVYLIPNIGWSSTFVTFAIITGGLAIPLILLVIRSEPSNMGLLPDGKKTPAITDINGMILPSTRGLTMKMALSTQAFWLMAVAIFFIFSHMGVMQNQVPHLEDLGFTAGIVASTMSIISILSIVGTFVFGWLCDRLSVKLVGVIGAILISVSIVLLISIKADSPGWLIWTYSTLLGLGIGSWMPVMSMLVSTNFGMVAYGTIFGALNFFQSIGAAMGPIISGYLYDKMNTYQWAFTIIAILVVLAIPLILAIRHPSSYTTEKI